MRTILNELNLVDTESLLHTHLCDVGCTLFYTNQIIFATELESRDIILSDNCHRCSLRSFRVTVGNAVFRRYFDLPVSAQRVLVLYIAVYWVFLVTSFTESAGNDSFRLSHVNRIQQTRKSCFTEGNDIHTQ
jgi:hypothetical protein